MSQSRDATSFINTESVEKIYGIFFYSAEIDLYGLPLPKWSHWLGRDSPVINTLHKYDITLMTSWQRVLCHRDII